MRTLIAILFTNGMIFLQVYLSKRKSKWVGLILPIISILFSIFIVLNIVLLEDESISQTIYTFVFTLIIANIPTCVFLAIYFNCRSKIKVQN